MQVLSRLQIAKNILTVASFTLSPWSNVASLSALQSFNKKED